MTNQLQTTSQKPLAKPKFSVYMSQDNIKALVQQAVGKNAQRFTTSIISAVSTNPQLQDCTQQSILSAALIGESLNLSPSPQLSQYYLVPFSDKKRGMVAQFQLGYKGYIQLAIRSGYYKKLNVIAVKEGELISYDALNEEIEVSLIEDEEAREKAETIGYYAMFEYTNGFRKSLYWSKSKMEAHANRYSQGYKARKGYTFWEKDFDSMAFKTMLRQLISKWGVMSIEMQTAYLADNAVVDSNGTPDLVEYDDSEEVLQEASKVEEKTASEEEEDFDFFESTTEE